MKLYGAPNPAPNPRRVRIFLAEKGIDLPEIPVNMMRGEHKTPEFKAKNSLGQIPILELDDGTVIAETVSICRYLEAVYPDKPLFGTSPLEAAQIDMAIRRIEFQLMTPVGMFWRHAHPYTAKLLTQYKEFGESNRETAERVMTWLDRELEGHDYMVGNSFSMADIAALTTIDFAAWIGLPMPGGLERLGRWHAAVSARPSANA
jgi:glutathione S-transferase